MRGEKRFRRALAALCAAALLGGMAPALAAEGAGISVQMDGEELAFSDAVPEAADGRVFLPARAVFEALGAQVSYDAASQSATAVRGDTTVTFTLGEGAAQVETGGIVYPLQLDRAPYAKGNRMYVPLRFAAQAFGCMVGWDADDSTVILIDTEKLVADTLDRYEFSYLEQALTWGQRYETGAWDVEMDFDQTATYLDAEEEAVPLALGGSVSGTIADNRAAELMVNLRMDLLTYSYMVFGDDALLNLDGAPSGARETLETMKALLEEGVQMEVRGDLETGPVYYTVYAGNDPSLPLMTASGGWIAMDVQPSGEPDGLLEDLDILTAPRGPAHLLSLLASIRQGDAEPDDRDTAYEAAARMMDEIARTLENGAWTSRGADRTLRYDLDREDGYHLTYDFALTMDGGEAVDRRLELTVLVQQLDGRTDTLALTETGDADGNVEADLTIEMPGEMMLERAISGRYTPTKAAPETEPPEGAVVFDMTRRNL